MKGFTTLGLLLGCLLTQVYSKMIFMPRDASDTRYPDHIAEDPRITCPEDGSFPHPADCTWFYRCVEIFVPGYFKVYFFKCEPGTVFLDPIDQCVWGDPEICPSVSTTPLVTGPTGPPSSPSPPETSSSTTTEPASTTSYPLPPDPETTFSTTEATLTSPLPPSPPPTPLCWNCTWEAICEDVMLKVCNFCRYEDGEIRTPEEQCPNISDPYLDRDGQCLDAQDYCNLLRQDLPKQLPVNNKDNTKDDDENDPHYTVHCTKDQIRPDNPKIRDLFCHPYHYCSSYGSYLLTQNLCRNFFQCYKGPVGSWTVELKECNGPYLFNYDLDQCVPEPIDGDLC